MIAVTVTVRVSFQNLDSESRELWGISTVVAPDITHLPLESPKAPATAFKNAVAQLGDLFGRSLNRGNENLPVIKLNNSNEAAITLAFEELKKKINAAKTKETAFALLDSSEFKLNQELKALCNSKPPRKIN
jgi:hypothetical protein